MKKGFSLIEILIAVVLIAVLSVIAIPGLINARIIANEGAAIQTLNALHLALEMYMKSHEVYPDYFSILLTVTPPYIAGEQNITIDNEWLRMTIFTKGGYQYVYITETGAEYDISAIPVIDGRTGKRIFAIRDPGRVLVYNGSTWDPL